MTFRAAVPRRGAAASLLRQFGRARRRHLCGVGGEHERPGDGSHLTVSAAIWTGPARGESTSGPYQRPVRSVRRPGAGNAP
eukprot:CAMPEP_0182548490 /NCGR_PEP_ID=MMETSP1323-20130603/38876_1 /TAXON_ID=236787 /ORGANISM="Florenciella parvula, Strain RCC1693" /LENGTH=80 /DNA_ID=CAMNT_0024759887 /DNA_START=481 /DNA_END=720 /DNA_ORIENTATION=-